MLSGPMASASTRPEDSSTASNQQLQNSLDSRPGLENAGGKGKGKGKGKSKKKGAGGDEVDNEKTKKAPNPATKAKAKIRDFGMKSLENDVWMKLVREAPDSELLLDLKHA